MNPERRETREFGTGASFTIRTYGCQMNVHDSEKIANLLQHAGMRAAETPEDADLLVINTCSIRDKAEHQLYSDLGRLRLWKDDRPGRVLGVGGCVAQQVGDGLLKRFGHLDFVFGTHNLRLVPAMAAAARAGERLAHTEESRSLERFDLPDRHPAYRDAEQRPLGAAGVPGGSTPGRAFLTVMEGCDMFCSFCIVPQTRGREISRPADAIVAEARALAEHGVVELTLLGQTVNAYGRHDLRRQRGDAPGTVAFSELLRRLDAIPGIERLRYMSPHPLFFDAGLVRAHAELESLCPHVHLPLQSGSDRILERMRRRYTRAQYLDIARALRATRPDLVITTDLIVGFPGESAADFADTLAVMREVGFVDAYSFKYSPRPGTAAAALSPPVPAEEAQSRLVELQSLQRGLTIAYHRSRVGRGTRILVEGESRRGTEQLRGRDPYHRVVNVSRGPDGAPPPGALLGVEIVEATPHSLIGI